MDTKEIARLLGKERLATELGVTLSAVNEAARSGKFPASWYLAVKRLADMAGVDVPDEVFNFKGAA